MKIILTLFLCAAICVIAKGQTEAVPELGVDEISLARDDGSGNFGEESTEFLPSDIPIHCFVLLNRPGAVTVRMDLIAVKAESLKPETRVVRVGFTTGEKDDRVNFTASPAKAWRVGTYRADIFLDGKLAAGKEFEIKVTGKPLAAQGSSALSVLRDVSRKAGEVLR